MLPPRYVVNETELEQCRRQAKQWVCPHCRRAGDLNGHGRVRGLSADGPGKEAVRGQRFFCSNRGRRRGCGRTFCVRLAQVIAGASVRSQPWWRFISARLDGASVAAAWEKARSGFSLEAAYRWWRRWRPRESAVRTGCWTAGQRGRAPPEAKSLREAIEGAYGRADPVAAFQAREQRPFPAFAS